MESLRVFYVCAACLFFLPIVIGSERVCFVFLLPHVDSFNGVVHSTGLTSFIGSLLAFSLFRRIPSLSSLVSRSRFLEFCSAAFNEFLRRPLRLMERLRT